MGGDSWTYYVASLLTCEAGIVLSPEDYLYSNAINFAGQASPYDRILHTKLYDQGWVFGNITLKLVGPNEVRAYQDTYDFDYKSNLNPLS